MTITGLALLIYVCTVATAALIAVLAPTSQRRRAARDILNLLLRHRV